MPQSQWIFPKSALMNTPSIAAGMSPSQERELRAKACNFIIQVGIKLKLPQLTIATASVFLHRFYMRVPIQQHHHYDTAATALFLATKVEENMRRYENLITECIRCAQKNPNHPPVDRNSSEFWKWSDVIQEKEEVMLEALCFDLNIPQSYDFLLQFSRKLGMETKELIRSAWSLLNDSHLSVICLLFRPEAIAAAALGSAAERNNTKLEEGWHDRLGVTDKELRRAKRWLLAIYEWLSPPSIPQTDANGTRNHILRPPGPEDLPDSPTPTPEHRSTQSTPAHKRPYEDTKEAAANGNGNGNRVEKRPRYDGMETNGGSKERDRTEIQVRKREDEVKREPHIKEEREARREPYIKEERRDPYVKEERRDPYIKDERDVRRSPYIKEERDRDRGGGGDYRRKQSEDEDEGEIKEEDLSEGEVA